MNKMHDWAIILYRDDEYLIKAIETYGVNREDRYSGLLVWYLDGTSFSKIDIILRYKPQPSVLKTKDSFYWPIMDNTQDDKDIYIARKILEADDQGLYVRSRVNSCRFIPKTSNMTMLEVFDFFFDRNETGTRVFGYYVDRNRVRQHHELLKSHRNRHFTLFEHMLPILNNKKRRFQ